MSSMVTNGDIVAVDAVNNKSTDLANSSFRRRSVSENHVAIQRSNGSFHDKPISPKHKINQSSETVVSAEEVAKIPLRHGSVVSKRYYKRICLSAMVFYFVVHAIIGCFPVCSGRVAWDSWSRDIFILIGGWFMASTFLQINRTLLASFKEENDIGTLSSYYASFCVNCMAGCSQLSSSLTPWGGTCTDAFGVLTPASQWLEWLVCVPLLMFIAISVDDKPKLELADHLTVLSMLLCIACGALLQATSSKLVSAALITLSMILVSVSPYQMYVAFQNWKFAVTMSSLKTTKAKRGMLQRKILLASRKFTLCSAISFLFPVFPCIYMLRAYGLFGQEVGMVATAIASAFVKILFASLCMDAHLEVSHPAVALIDAEKFSSEIRHSLLRYVFHEVRVPLNSISLGVQVLNASINPETPEHETLDIIRDSLSHLSETLSDVMALQSIEEGSMKLVYRPFSLKHLLEGVEMSFSEIFMLKKLRLRLCCGSGEQATFSGDRVRIRHVMCNLISNSVKASYPGGVVTIVVDVEEAPDRVVSMMQVASVGGKSPARKVLDASDYRLVTISIRDEGCGMSAAVQESDIFSPFSALKSGDISGERGRGLGLAICREIVHMHHGWISYTSEEGKGSKFSITLPLEVVTATAKDSPVQMHRSIAVASSHFDILRPEQYILHDDTTFSAQRTAKYEVPIVSAMSNSYSSDAVSNIVLAGVRCDRNGSSETGSEGTDDDWEEKEEAERFAKKVQLARKVGIKILEAESSDREERSARVPKSALDFTIHSNFEAISAESKNQLPPISAATTTEDSTFVRAGSSRVSSLSESNLQCDDNDDDNNDDYEDTQRPVRSTVAAAAVSATVSDRSDSEAEKSENLLSYSVSCDAESNSPSCRMVGRHSKSLHDIDCARNSGSRSSSPPTPVSSRDGLLSAYSSCSENSIFSRDTRKKLTRHTDPAFDSSEVLKLPALSTSVHSSPRQRLSEHATALTPPIHPKGSAAAAGGGFSRSENTPRLKRTFSENYKLFNLLLVDDVLSNRKLLAMLLKKKGIGQIFFAEDGEVAVETVKSRGNDFFDLIFMDNTMPRKTGIDATEELRDLGFRKVIIGLTGNSFEDELAEFERIGANLVLTKPMKPNTLTAILAFLGERGVVFQPNERFRVTSDDGVVVYNL